MSFSGQVKEELFAVTASARHCQLAEIASILQFCGKVYIEKKSNKTPGYFLQIQTENKLVARKCFTLLKKAFNIYSSVTVRQHKKQSKNLSYIISIDKSPDVEIILQALKWKDEVELRNGQNPETHSVLLRSNCCKRAFLRGAYMAIGSMSDPEKSYHLEFVCQHEEHAQQLVGILADFSLEGKIVLRKKYFVVYLKEGEGIVNLLNVMEAHVALMELENTRILKEMRNSINRKVNCEAANISKTVNAATKQVEDILCIKEHYGLENLPDNLCEIAKVRLDNPDATLKELGELLNPKVGKSGVNHRLRRLTEIAEKIKVGN